MRAEYAALLARLDVPAVNVDRVRQRLTGQVGVNPGDVILFSTELLRFIVEQSLPERATGAPYVTCPVMVRDVTVVRTVVAGQTVTAKVLRLDSIPLADHGALIFMTADGLS